MLNEYGLIETKAKFVKVGDLFGRLEVLAVGQVPFVFKYYAVCECECGTVKRIRSDSLINGVVVSCGCYRLESVTKHGKTDSGHYGRWHNMMDRCYNEKCLSYKNYGARGVKVCERWHDVSNYVDDIEGGHFENAELDRIDNDGDYSPNNTKWSTKSQNCRNRQNTRFLAHGGKSQCVADWADETGISLKIICERIDRQGWSIERALTEPVADVHENMLMAQAKRWEGHTKVAKRKPKTTRKIKTIEYKGETMTIKQLSVIVGVSAKLLSKRLFERGWSLERAVKNENFKGTNQFTKESTCKFQQ